MDGTLDAHYNLDSLILGIKYGAAGVSDIGSIINSEGWTDFVPKSVLKTYVVNIGKTYLGERGHEYLAEYMAAAVEIEALMKGAAECTSGVGFNLRACSNFVFGASTSLADFLDEVFVLFFLNSYLEQKNELLVTDHIIRERVIYGHDVAKFINEKN